MFAIRRLRSLALAALASLAFAVPHASATMVSSCVYQPNPGVLWQVLIGWPRLQRLGAVLTYSKIQYVDYNLYDQWRGYPPGQPFDTTVFNPFHRVTETILPQNQLWTQGLLYYYWDGYEWVYGANQLFTVIFTTAAQRWSARPAAFE